MTGGNRFPDSGTERLLEFLSTSVLIFDDQLLLRYINPAGEVLLAQSARHACGKSLRDLIANAEMVTEHLCGTLETRQVLTQRACRLDLVNGQATVVVNCTHTPVSIPGEFSGVMLELRKVDHLKRIEQDEQLLIQQEATHALLRGLAHEIKNPLGGLRGAAQLLEREIHGDDLKEYTQIIIREADRLQNLIDRMLWPKNIPHIQPVNIHHILERVSDLVLVEVPNGLKITKDYDPSLPELQADPDLLVQAVLNIVRNAVQALEGHGEIILRTRVRRQFNIGTRRHRLVACVQVIDNGPGITEDMREKIFYPMVSTRSDGTGLGLSIAQSLINRHKGLIECSSEPGKTVFTILLPLDNIQ
jgi:two-component system nitrogen regulation sensor histidine kinase GlnL